MAERLQDRLERQQVRRVVVDDQDAGARLDRLRPASDRRAAVVPGDRHCAGYCSADAVAVAGPQPDEVQQLVGVDRLGQVVGRAGLEALLAVVLQRLGGDGDDRAAPRKLGFARIARIVS